MRRANPFLAQKNKWSLDLDEIRNEIDAYNAKLCEAMGWKDYIVTDIPEGGPPKPWPRSHLAHVGRAVGVGASTILEMFGSAGPIRDKPQATNRARICSACPRNAPGGWERFFTLPASNLLRKALGYLKDLDLTTPYDEKLGTCVVCGCVLKLKCHTRLEHILAHTSEEELKELDPKCWILAEKKVESSQPLG